MSFFNSKYEVGSSFPYRFQLQDLTYDPPESSEAFSSEQRFLNDKRIQRLFLASVRACMGGIMSGFFFGFKAQNIIIGSILGVGCVQHLIPSVAFVALGLTTIVGVEKLIRKE